MIQKTIRNDRGETETLSEHDPRYWQGPYHYEPYPKLLFRASAGKYQDSDLEHQIVQNRSQHEQQGIGWQESPDLARAQYDKVEAELAAAAAESNYADRGMSAKAKAEKHAHEHATEFDMVVTVPAPAPRLRKKPGRKSKTEIAALAAGETTHG